MKVCIHSNKADRQLDNALWLVRPDGSDYGGVGDGEPVFETADSHGQSKRTEPESTPPATD